MANRGQKEDTGLASAARGQRSQTTAAGGQEKDTKKTRERNREDTARTRGGQEENTRNPREDTRLASKLTQQDKCKRQEDTRRTRPGHRAQGCGQRLWPIFF